MTTAFEVRSADSDSGFRLDLHDPEFGIYEVTVWSPGCKAETQVDLERDTLVDYFEGMARDWRGWVGSRVYGSLAPEVDYGLPVFRLTSRADGRGHIRVSVEVGEPYLPDHEEPHRIPPSDDPGTWATKVAVMIEAGQLDELAQGAIALPRPLGGRW